jgi:hypothetical protein
MKFKLCLAITLICHQLKNPTKTGFRGPLATCFRSEMEFFPQIKADKYPFEGIHKIRGQR